MATDVNAAPGSVAAAKKGSMTLRERAQLLAAAKRDPQIAAKLYIKCKRDRVFFINLCLWTFDPRIKDRLRRYKAFLLFAKQEDYVREIGAAIDGGYDLLTEKSRDTGATWCNLAVILHGWIFEQGFNALLGSRKEDQVDKAGDPSSMFWKLDFMIQYLPEWIFPPGFVKKAPYRTYLKLENPHTGSVITGESSNPDFGRGGRYTVIFLDEFASWEWASPAWTSCSESTTCRLPNSTPKGLNFFGRLANDSNPDTAIAKFRIHWKDDPRHTAQVFDQRKGVMVYPYLERARKKFGYDISMMAQELDIDYNRSVKGRIYPQVDFAKVGLYRYNPNYPLYCAWDFGLTDKNAIVWYQWAWDRNRFQWIDCYESRGQTIDFYIPFVTGQIPTGTPYEYTETEIAKINYHRGWRVDEHYGDPAGRQRNQVTNTSVIDELARPRPTAGAPNGIHVITNTASNTFEIRKTSLQMMLIRSDFDEAHCGMLLDALRNSRFQENPEGGNSTSLTNKPVHDDFSHLRTACEYAAVNQTHTEEEFAPDVPAEGQAGQGGYWQGGRFHSGQLPGVFEEEDDFSMQPRGKAGY